MKKTTSWPKPPDFDLDDDIGLLIGNRIHRVTGGQVIGQMVVKGDAVNTFAVPPAAPRKAKRKARRPARKPRAASRASGAKAA